MHVQRVKQRRWDEVNDNMSGPSHASATLAHIIIIPSRARTRARPFNFLSPGASVFCAQKGSGFWYPVISPCLLLRRSFFLRHLWAPLDLAFWLLFLSEDGWNKWSPVEWFILGHSVCPVAIFREIIREPFLCHSFVLCQ